MIHVLPTDIEVVQLRESLLSGIFSCINRRLGFDSEVFSVKSFY